ncbi:MAG: UvrD-helicase domain-containing protein [Oscillospiraceae bacterium]|nr:UvrD-helicase domain-containing protein [Oscillospiraceae bacterium]
MKLLEHLNANQREAVTATEGYIRVIAGAGSGKTRALAHRYAYLVNEIGILPENILCVTFTNKSAAEMKKRIRQLAADADTGYISTFHSFCVSVLQEDIHIVHYPKSFIVLDNPDIDAMLKTVYEERNLTMRDMTFSKARDMIEMKKNKYAPEYYKPMLSMTVDELREKYLSATGTEDIIFWGYVYQEKKCFALDYNDLIHFVLHIFDISPETRLKWQERLEYIMIDEYQDIDDLQYQLMKALCPLHGNLFVVGDPDQTIYTWRGASVKFILNFDQDFPNVRTIMMNENYRSTPEILAVANDLIAKNKARVKKKLLAQSPGGPLPVYHHAATNHLEAEWIANEIRDLTDHGVSFSEIAILYRAHYLSRELEDVFLNREIPYTIYSGVQFFQRMEVKDALSYLRMVIYKDDLSFLRIANVPKRNIGQRRMTFLKECAVRQGCTLYQALLANLDHEIFRGTKAKQFVKLVEGFSQDCEYMLLSEMLTLLLDRSGYEAQLRLEGSQERLDNLAELKQAIINYEDSCGEECRPEDYLDRVALMTNNDLPDSKNAVKLMTVHTAKGLEFPYVFVVGMNEGIFPSKKTANVEGMEEERRLAFVALTRAEKGLYLTEPEGKNLDGSYRYPSRFLFNIDRSLLRYTTELDPLLVEDSRRFITASEHTMEQSGGNLHLSPGDRVSHMIMGNGTVKEVDLRKAAYLIQFDDLPTPRKLSFKAPLTRLSH